eukprot:3283165-Pyramimonas_sp.AAC.4
MVIRQTATRLLADSFNVYGELSSPKKGWALSRSRPVFPRSERVGVYKTYQHGVAPLQERQQPKTSVSYEVVEDF